MGKKIILALIFALFSVEFSNAQIASIHPLDDWMRDPYIVLAPNSNYYLTCTQYTKDSENIKMPVYKSSDLKKWEFVGFNFSLKDFNSFSKLTDLASNSPNQSVSGQAKNKYNKRRKLI